MYVCVPSPTKTGLFVRKGKKKSKVKVAFGPVLLQISGLRQIRVMVVVARGSALYTLYAGAKSP